VQRITVQAAIAVLLALALSVLAIIWLSTAVGVKNSACERYSYTSGCR